MNRPAPIPTTETSAQEVRPDFLVIGAQKCATTWLYYCLREHPALHLPAHKREVEYLGGDLYQERGADWYFGLLAGRRHGQVAGDVSVDYLWDARSPDAVHRHAPGVKLIALLRDPVARASSAYFWYVRKGHLPDIGVERALAAGMAGDAAEDLGASARSYARDLIERGFYDVQLARWRERFDASRFLIVLYDEVASDPRAVLRRIYGFLGVDPDFVPPSLERTPKRNSYSTALMRIDRFLSRLPRPVRRVALRVTDAAHALLRDRGDADEVDLPRELRRRLREVYAPHTQRLGELIAALPASGRPRIDPASAWDSAP